MKKTCYRFRRPLPLFLSGVLSCCLLWSAIAAGKPPWYGDKDCRSKQQIRAQSRVDRFSYDAKGKIVANLWDAGRATCVLWFNICGDTIFKSKEINTNAETADTEKPRKGATPLADLAVDIHAPHRFPLGVTPFAVTVKNYGPGDAAGVRLKVAPGSAKLVYATTSQGKCRVADGSVQCEFDTIPSNKSRAVSIQMRTETEGEVVISSEVSSGTPDPNSANNDAQATIEVKKAVKGTWSAPK